MILAVLAQHADVEGIACLSYSSIARQTGIGKNSIRGLVDELERAGRVDVLQRGPAGSRYRVVECAPRLRKRTASPALDRRLALVGLLALVALGAIVVTWIYPASFPPPYLLYAVVSIGLGAAAGTTLVWTLDAWRAFARAKDRETRPAHSFALMVPADRDEARLEATLSRLLHSDRPPFEVHVVVRDDDVTTRAAAERVAQRHLKLVKVVVDALVFDALTAGRPEGGRAPKRHRVRPPIRRKKAPRAATAVRHALASLAVRLTGAASVVRTALAAGPGQAANRLAPALLGGRRLAGAIRRRLSRRMLLGLLLALAIAAAAAGSIHSTAFLYLLYVGVSVVLGGVAWTTLIWMLNAWRTPGSLSESRLKGDDIEPVHSFSLIVPARHEEAVLEATLTRLLTSDHPDYEVLVVVGDDDPGTREVAERVADGYPGIVSVVVDASRPKSKPKALNAALPYCTREIVGVFDAEDVVHPTLLTRVDQRFQRTHADVVQAGVQLMNFRSSWLTVRNVLEYYFWFRSRLHVHARQGFIPLGGNTVFIRTRILRAVSGWDGECLAEDCELGVRLSSHGARTVVVYEPELVTREECPPTLGSFARQRTRWNQGFLQTLSKGYWRRLPRRQRVLGAYILTTPYLMALTWLLLPVALVTAVTVKAPVPITLISFSPALPILSMLAVEIAGLGEFCRAYGERTSLRDYGRLVVGLPVYQAVLAFAAARAVVREARGARGWEKTAHLGLHLAQGANARQSEAPLMASPRLQPAAAGARVLEARAPVAQAIAASPTGSNGTIEPASWEDGFLREYLPGQGANGNGDGAGGHLTIDDLSSVVGSQPLWVRLDGGSASLSKPSAPATDSAPARHTSRLLNLDLAVQLTLLAGVGLVQAMNMLHWPGVLFDEGTYVGNAWAVQNRGTLAFYTYTYGHPPLAWLLIFLWTWTRDIFGHVPYSLDLARELMFVVSMASCSLLYTLARRLDMSPVFAAGAVVLFALSPVALFFHRGVLLDNPATAWAIAAFVLAMTPRRRLWAFAASGVCFAFSVLSKETTFVLLPALLLAAAQNTDRRTRRYCLTLFVSFLAITAAAYPLYATLKGELIPGPGHVSLLGTIMDMLFGRQGTGSVFDPHSVAHGTVMFWLRLDPWLVATALLLTPIALVRRNTRAIALAYLIQVVMILRPGYLPAMYVIALLPFAALIVAGSAQAGWRVITSPGAKRRLAAGEARWRVIGHRAAALLRPVAIAATAVAMTASAAVAVLVVAPRWARADRAAMTVRLDWPQRDAERWLVDHVDHKKRLIVTDDFWLYLVQHGFDHHRVRGGFNSRTVVSYWPLDKDPAVRRYFPRGWREFDYVVSTEAMRDTATYTPSTEQALQHSRVVARFGDGPTRIDIRAIEPAEAP